MISLGGKRLMLYFTAYLLIGSIYMLRNIYSNMHLAIYNKLSIELKILSMVSDLVLWPLCIGNDIRIRYNRNKKRNKK